MAISPRIYLFTILLSVCITTLALPAGAAEENAVITELTAVTAQNELLLFATLKNGFQENMFESLQSGITLDFSFLIELYKTTPGWPDELITETSFKHSISYDTLRDDYIVILEEKDNQTERFSSLLEAQHLLGRINGASVTPLTQLIPEHTYQIRVRAELAQKTLPLGVHRIIPFIARKDVKTDWHYLDFSY